MDQLEPRRFSLEKVVVLLLHGFELLHHLVDLPASELNILDVLLSDCDTVLDVLVRQNVELLHSLVEA